MSDNKFCPFCGASLSSTAVFCHLCGQKQKEIVPVSEVNTDSSIETNPVETVFVENSPVNEVVTPVKEVTENVVDNEKTEYSSHDDKPVEPQIAEATEPPAQKLEQVQPELVQPESVQAQVRQPQATEISQPSQQVQSPRPAQPVQQPVQPAGNMSGQYMPPPNQQPTYPPHGLTQAPVHKAPKKKKFPWFFTITWFTMFLAVGIWAYFFLVDANYDYPRFTEDAQRIVLFTVAIATLIYTLSLKLTMKKLRGFPAVILVAAILVIFYFFCMVELTDQDWLHQVVSDLTEKVLPAFGN